MTAPQEPIARDSRLARQIAFIKEVDALKRVLRRTSLLDGSRLENSAEHSWHLACSAVALAEHAVGTIDISRVIRMLLVHDLVEIDAGDTFAYDRAGLASQAERESAAADRIFGELPDDQATELRALWDDFERATVGDGSDDARFALALDRLGPLLQNDQNAGGTWREHGVSRVDVLRRMTPIERAIPGLWPLVLDVVDRNCAAGHIRSGAAVDTSP